MSALLFFILCLYFLHPIPLDIQNGDLGRHLLLGKIIVNSGNVPLTNLISYTNTNYPFINTHWLSEVIFYLLYTVSGFNGLIILTAVLSVITLALVFIPTIRKFDSFATILITLVYLQVYFERTEVRPEVFSMLLLAIFITILYKYRKKYTRWIFTLIPLELFWVNFHIYFFVGIVILLLFLLDAYFAKKEAFNSKKTLTLAFVTIAAGLVTLCNPNFINGAVYPLLVLHNYGVSIQENDNFFLAMSLYKDPSFFFFGLSLIVLWLAIFFARKKMTRIDIFLATFFTFMGIFAVRDFTLFVIGTFIPAVTALSSLTTFISHKFQEEKVRFIKITFLIIVSLIFIPSIKADIDIHGIGLGVTDNARDAADFLLKNNLDGTIYNNFTIGSYLAYRLYPKEKVFVDGRPEAYPKEFFQNIYYPMQTSQTVFDQTENKYNFNTIFLDYTDTSENQLINQLLKSNTWKMIYLNSEIVIFVKNISTNQQIIKEQHIDQNNVIINNADMNNENKVRQLANFFGTIGWEKQQLTMTLRYLQFNPKNCNALETTAYLLQKSHDPRTFMYINKYDQTCGN